jgi:hypothetical protein
VLLASPESMEVELSKLLPITGNEYILDLCGFRNSNMGKIFCEIPHFAEPDRFWALLKLHLDNLSLGPRFDGA